MKSLLPNLNWLYKYRWNFFSGDLVAGMTVGFMLVPQAIAYAMLAGLDPQVGLYASLLPLIVYALWGQSNYVSVAPVAITSLFVAHSIGPLAGGDPSIYVELVILLAFLEGTLQISLSFFRLGFIINFLGLPVINGYISAAAITIIISQVNVWFGFSIERSSTALSNLIDIVKNLYYIQWNTFFIGVVVIAILLYSKTLLKSHLIKVKISLFQANLISKSMPLFILIASIFFMKTFSIEGVSILGSIPQGLPHFLLPSFSLDNILLLLPIALYLSMISFMETISVGKSLADKQGENIDYDKELRALGMCSVASSLSGGYSVSGSLSRSVVNHQSGAKTPMSSVITAFVLLIAISFFVSDLYYLPKVVLSSVVVVAIYNMIQWSALIRTWKLNKIDGISFLVSFLAVLIFGVKYGLLGGILTSIFLYMWVTSHPHIAILGQVENTEHFRNILRFKVKTYSNLLIIRIDESLTFVNSKFCEEKLWAILKEYPDTKTLLINAGDINYIDTSALNTLEAFIKRLKYLGIDFAISEIKGPVMDFLNKADFTKTLPIENIYLSTYLAVQAIVKKK